MKQLLIFAAAFTLAAGSRSYRSESHNNRHNREDRRISLDYDDIETADQDKVERFDDDSRKSNRVGVYSTVHSIQVAKNKAQQRRHSKLAGFKDSEASGTQFEGTHYGAYAGGAQVQQIHTHELLTGQGLVPFYQTAPNAHAGGNIILSGGIGVSGLADNGAHHGPVFVAGGPGTVLTNPHHHHHHAGLALANHPVAPGVLPQPENDLREDITKSVYVFSAPPDPFDHVPRQTLTKLPPQRPQKHYQVLFINSPTSPQQQHHVELPPPPELKTLVYVLVKKPQPSALNFIKPAIHPHPHKPEVYFIRYKNRGAYGLPPSSGLGPGADETLPVGHAHPGVQYAPIAHQEELRGNIDYGPALPAQYEAPAHPYDLEGYHQDDSHLSASQVLSQRSSAREVDAGVTGTRQPIKRCSEPNPTASCQTSP